MIVPAGRTEPVRTAVTNPSELPQRPFTSLSQPLSVKSMAVPGAISRKHTRLIWSSLPLGPHDRCWVLTDSRATSPGMRRVCADTPCTKKKQRIGTIRRWRAPSSRRDIFFLIIPRPNLFSKRNAGGKSTVLYALYIRLVARGIIEGIKRPFWARNRHKKQLFTLLAATSVQV